MRGVPERDAIDTTDRDRAAFVKKYLKRNWPQTTTSTTPCSTQKWAIPTQPEILARCANELRTQPFEAGLPR